MQHKIAAVLIAAMVGSASAVLVGSKPANTSAPRNATLADVAKLHHKMETVAFALEGMLKPETRGSLASAKVAPALRSFVTELRATLNATTTPKDVPAAMKRLRNAQAGMVELTKALNQQQERLMREDATEETNLLMGVLMVRRSAPMAEQLEVLKGGDFSGLPVSKALLAKHDDKTPLFQQVAAYMDKHGTATNATSADERARRLAKSVAYFSERAEKMTHEEQLMQKMHKRRDAEIDLLIKKTADKVSAHRLQLEKKKADHDFKKRVASHKQQTKVMMDIVSAMKKGDTAALKKAQEALQAHLRAMKAQTGNFLYLLQVGHRLANRDCPFCVAQCIGNCHDGGSPYGVCMAECATAGQ